MLLVIVVIVCLSMCLVSDDEIGECEETAQLLGKCDVQRDTAAGKVSAVLSSNSTNATATKQDQVVQQLCIFKLEISGKAQRESARHPKSDWGKLGGSKISPASKSHARTQMHWYTPNAHFRLRVGQHERL